MKKFLFLLLAVALLIECGRKMENGFEVIETKKDINGKKLTIKMTTGKHWKQPFKFKSYTGTTTPQIAVWIEDINGNYLETLYVTYRFASQKWWGPEKQDPDKVLRVSSIPYWMYKRKKAGGAFPTKNKPLADAITGASPKNNFLIKTKFSKSSKKIRILIEVNNSFNMNKVYKSFFGQPAVVYMAEVDPSKKGKTGFKYIGHSEVSGKNGKLFKSKKNLTTALELVKDAFVEIK